MLTQLSIQNYALIEHLELQLQPGMTVLTGETGSGKSIIIGALGLILGQRADSALVKDPERKCIVEAIFRVDPKRFKSAFEQHDLDLEEEITIRREISTQGKSRAFINDTPVKLPVLTEISGRLVDLHSQHDNLILGKRHFILSVLDGVADQSDSTEAYSRLYHKRQDAQKRLEELKEQEHQARLDEDYLNFQLNELEEIQFNDIDPGSLEDELNTLSNAEEIKSGLQSAYYALEEGDQNIIAVLHDILHQIERVSSNSKQLDEFKDRINSSLLELKDLASEMTDYEQNLNVDQERIAELEELNNKLNSLLHKHRLQDVAELEELKSSISERLNSMDSLEEEIRILQEELNGMNLELKAGAQKLSEGRKKAATQLERSSAQNLSDLMMPHAEMTFKLNPSEPGPDGMDEPELLFRANKGGQAKPIQKVASGGEISRVMLAIKAVIAEHRKLPTVILDEVDTGVSGEAASRMGQLMKSLSGNAQVISITHLPQVAGLADNHFKVVKTTTASDTTTSVIALDQEQRIMELAGLLSGEETTEAAIENAKNLLRK